MFCWACLLAGEWTVHLPRNCCGASAWATVLNIIHDSCPPASNNALPSPARSPAIRNLSSPTSFTGNLDHANARAALSLIRETCREQGAALLLVSHDREVLAEFASVQDLRQINNPRNGQEAE